MDVLIIGGSGFVSGTLAQRARDAGYTVTIVTRGKRSVPEGVRALSVDRKDAAAFAQAIEGENTSWDFAVDSIGYTPDDAKQDIEVVAPRCDHLVFISTDFVYEPSKRRFPQPEDADAYIQWGYGGNKRKCELLFEDADFKTWSIVRPCHITGPGSQLGCLPKHGRDPNLIDAIREGRPLELAGGGIHLQQPVFAPDLADTIISMAGKPETFGTIMNTAGPDIIESRTYYRIIGEILGTTVEIREVSVTETLAEKPELATFLCHRIYVMSRLAETGVSVPATGIREQLEKHVASML